MSTINILKDLGIKIVKQANKWIVYGNGTKFTEDPKNESFLINLNRFGSLLNGILIIVIRKSMKTIGKLSFSRFQ